MSIQLLKKLPTPTEIKADYPVTQKVAQIKAERDEMIRKVFTGESDKFLVIIGPCSADNEEAVCEYINRLSRVQEEVADKLILIPRIYTNKPRTTGEGYKGILHQPDPEKKPDLLHGLIAIRKMHMRAIEESGLTAADEMLYPETWRYLDDILSYVAIGALLCGESAASYGSKRYGCSSGYEKSNQWGSVCDAEFCCGSTDQTELYLQKLGG